MPDSSPAGSVRRQGLPVYARIGLVGPLPPPSGGIPNQTLQLAGLLRAEGYELDLIQCNRAYRPAWAGRLPVLRALFRLFPYLLELWRSAGRVRLFHVMANSGWSWHLFAAPAVLIGWLRGCPVIVNYRGGEADAFMAKSRAWVRPVLRLADAVVVPSGYLQWVFQKYEVDTVVVPNIVNLQRFAPPPVYPVSGFSRQAPRLLVARNLEAIYDNATALRAFALVAAAYPRATLVIAGSGPLLGELKALAASLGVAAAVTFTGRVDNAAMPGLYQAADILLNPSTVDNMPNSILEALASGVPVVSTDVGGIPFLVEHGRTALLVQPGAPQAMADAVLHLLDDAALAARLRSAGLEYVRRYAWPEVRPRLLAAYRSVLAAEQEGRERG
jgi:glycosyltransferase involved in cell wall biosynthesis